jgi:hypothetical protein
MFNWAAGVREKIECEIGLKFVHANTNIVFVHVQGPVKFVLQK